MSLFPCDATAQLKALPTPHTSGTNNEYGVATIRGSDTLYYNSNPVTSNNAIKWSISSTVDLVAINHSHPNTNGFSRDDKKSYKSLVKVYGSFTCVYMFDGGGNHRYGPKAPGFFGSRVFSCGGASATSWSCPTVSEDWKK